MKCRSTRRVCSVRLARSARESLGKSRMNAILSKCQYYDGVLWSIFECVNNFFETAWGMRVEGQRSCGFVRVAWLLLTGICSSPGPIGVFYEIARQCVCNSPDLKWNLKSNAASSAIHRCSTAPSVALWISLSGWLSHYATTLWPSR